MSLRHPTLTTRKSLPHRMFFFRESDSPQPLFIQTPAGIHIDGPKSLRSSDPERVQRVIITVAKDIVPRVVLRSGCCG